MKKKNRIIYLAVTLSLSIVFFVLYFFDVFNKIDYRFYDFLLSLRKEPPKTENILLVEIDDNSIEALGEWPWSRDVIADALLRMKELKAKIAIFDIEYISPSKNGIAPSAQEKINSSISSTQNLLADTVDQFSSAITSGFYSKKEIPELTNEMINGVINPSFDDLNSYISSNIYRDNDEYFAQCLQFFNNSWLTINNINLGYKPNKEEQEYVENRFLLQNVVDNKYLININNDYNFSQTYDEKNKGFTPALHKIVSHAQGIGFTNSVIDSDGTRRRMELLSEFNKKYIGQLIFAPFLSLTEYDNIIREKNFLILKNAKIPNSNIRKDYKIPLDENGCILINFRKGNIYDSFNTEAIISLIQLDQYESQIISCLNNITIDSVLDENGYEMESTVESQNLVNFYSNIILEKERLLEKCKGYDNDGNPIDSISEKEYQDYFNMREKFYSQLDAFISRNYKELILKRLSSLEQTDDVLTLISYVNEDFELLEKNLDTYKSLINELSPKYKDAYCIIGETATSTSDIGATPFEKQYQNVGLHANLLNTLLNESFIYPLPWYYGFAVVLLISLLMLLLIRRSDVLQNILYVFLTILILSTFIVLFVKFDYYIPCIGTIIFFIANFISNFAIRFYESGKEKKFITMMAASFANKDTVDELRKNPDAFKTGGQKKCITALFSDIQKFSTFSEKMDNLYGEDGPNKLIAVLNEYLGDMSKSILLNNGTIDKYEGDAIISMFGAPDPNNIHTPSEWAYYSIDSAIKMKKTEEEFNKNHFNKDNPEKSLIPNPLYTRIGLNSGDAFVGLMGSQTDVFNKLNYTMIGDTVNLASRLEGVNKVYNSWIMCSDSTWNLAKRCPLSENIVARKLDRVRVVGKSIPVQLYNIIGFKNELDSLELEKIEIFNTAYEKYLKKDFINAGKLFLQANSINKGDPTSLVFAERCKSYLVNGIPEDWDGIINMTNK